MARLDLDDVAGPDLLLCPVVHADRHPPLKAVEEVRRLTALRASERLDVLGPLPAWLEGATEHRLPADVDDLSLSVACELSGFVRAVELLDFDSCPRPCLHCRR